VTQVPLEAADPAVAPRETDVLALDRALEKLAALDARQAKVVELRYFGGLTLDETAEVLGSSASTVGRECGLLTAARYREVSAAWAANGRDRRALDAAQELPSKVAGVSRRTVQRRRRLESRGAVARPLAQDSFLEAGRRGSSSTARRAPPCRAV
jgi:hypothetical protein